MFVQGLQLCCNTLHTTRGVPRHSGGKLGMGSGCNQQGRCHAAGEPLPGEGERMAGCPQSSVLSCPVPSHPAESGCPTSRMDEQGLAREQKERIQGLC